MKKIISLLLVLVLLVQLFPAVSMAATIQVNGKSVYITAALVDSNGNVIGTVPDFSLQPTTLWDDYIALNDLIYPTGYVLSKNTSTKVTHLVGKSRYTTDISGTRVLASDARTLLSITYYFEQPNLPTKFVTTPKTDLTAFGGTSSLTDKTKTINVALTDAAEDSEVNFDPTQPRPKYISATISGKFNSTLKTPKTPGVASVSTSTSDSASYESNLIEQIKSISKANKNIGSYTTNIAYYFSDRSVLPMSKIAAEGSYRETESGRKISLDPSLSVDYGKEMAELEASGKNITEFTSIITIRHLIAHYLYNNPDYMPMVGNVITDRDVDQFKLASGTDKYVFPTNIPYYDKAGKFLGAYSIHSDKIVPGRNNVMQNFIDAYAESYDLAYSTDGDSIGEMFLPDDLRTDFGDTFYITNNPVTLTKSGKTHTYDLGSNRADKYFNLELFAMSLNYMRTSIVFNEKESEFIGEKDYADARNAEVIGYSVTNAPMYTPIEEGSNTSRDMAILSGLT